MPRRPPSRRRSTSAAARKARWRARQRDGEMVLPVTVNYRIVSWLVRLNWLAPRDTYRRAEIAEAVQRLIDDTVRGV